MCDLGTSLWADDYFLLVLQMEIWKSLQMPTAKCCHLPTAMDSNTL